MIGRVEERSQLRETATQKILDPLSHRDFCKGASLAPAGQGDRDVTVRHIEEFNITAVLCDGRPDFPGDDILQAMFEVSVGSRRTGCASRIARRPMNELHLIDAGHSENLPLEPVSKGPHTRR